jgi:signal recognition particle receptor subunit beta
MIREALDLDPEVPVVLCDARDRSSAKDVLITVVEHAAKAAEARRATAPM